MVYEKRKEGTFYKVPFLLFKEGKIKDMKGFDDFQENLMRCFVFKDDSVICADFGMKLAVKWNGEGWEEYDCEKAYKDSKDLSPEDAAKLAAFPPWDAMESIIKGREEKYKEYIEGLIKTTKRKVIGYINTAYGTDKFLPISAGNLTDEEYAAVIRDIRKNGYLYTGEHYQDSSYPCTPVLDNYRWVDFSRRGFGGVMARARGDYSSMGYCHYTERMFINSKYLKFPDGELRKGLTRAQSTIEVDEKTFELAARERKKRSGVLVAVPIPKDEEGYFWIGDGIYLRFGETTFKGEVQGVINFDKESEFTDFLGYRHIKCAFDSGALNGKPLLLVKMRIL